MPCVCLIAVCRLVCAFRGAFVLLFILDTNSRLVEGQHQSLVLWKCRIRASVHGTAGSNPLFVEVKDEGLGSREVHGEGVRSHEGHGEGVGSREGHPRY